MKTADHIKKYTSKTVSNLSRRNFLKAAGAGTALAVSSSVIPYKESRAFAQGSWDAEADIVVVGSGAAALSAATTAVDQGSDVIVLEKAAILGGTSLKSGAVYWVPNNTHQQAEGLEDPREDAIQYMARLSYPGTYQPNGERFGLSEWDYAQLEAYYDNGGTAIDELARIAGLESELWTAGDDLFPDYYHMLPENKQPLGRGLKPTGSSGVSGAGRAMIEPMVEYLESQDTSILLNHRVIALVQNDDGEVIGVRAVINDWADPIVANLATPMPEDESEDPMPENVIEIRARKAVVFGSGGFTHNREIRDKFLRGPIFGGCEVLTNEGDILPIATRVGAQMSNMNQAFWTQVILEPTLEIATNAYGGMVAGGDSMLEVNKYGFRVGSEKAAYNDFGQLHFTWDSARSEYPNLVLFLIYDQRTAKLVGGQNPYPREGTESPYLISGDTFEELSANISDRLDELGDLITGIQLHENFVENLQETVESFNEYARNGVDEKFYREQAPFSGGRLEGNDFPSGSMHPLSDTGPYHCIMTGPGVLGTKGGPKINTKAQIVDADDEAIPGLYGAGNCIGSPSAAAYWSGGGTLGLALIYGYLAGLNAAQEQVKEAN